MNWTDATKWSSGLASGACGLSDGSQAGDWRVPTIDELKSLICGPGAPAWLYNGCDGSNTYNPNGAYPFEWLKSQGFTAVQRDWLLVIQYLPDLPWTTPGYVNMYYGAVVYNY